MTGSGSCIYGIFENKQKAKLAYGLLKINTKLTYVLLTIGQRGENMIEGKRYSCDISSRKQYKIWTK